MVKYADPQLEIAQKLLLMPDLLSYMLCGEITSEYSNSTTTQMLDARGGWSKEIIKKLGIKRRYFAKTADERRA